MDDPTVAHPAPVPENIPSTDDLFGELGPFPFPSWPRADIPSRDIFDEFRESAHVREWDALERHLHEAEAERNGWEVETVEHEGRLCWPVTMVPAKALRAAFEFYFNALGDLYGLHGDPTGWTYWCARDMRDILNGLLERHDQWRRRALATGYPTSPDDVEEVEA